MLSVLETMIIAVDLFFDLDQFTSVALHLGLECVEQDLVIQVKHQRVGLDGLEVFDDATIGNLSFESFRAATRAVVVEILATIATRSTT
ncbi:MAG: hypothetical protein U0U09_14545 [Cyclobacteriaceae bacterium]